MKKLTVLLLALALLLSGIPALAESEQKWDGPVEPVVMAWLTGGVDNPYLDKVADAINEITRDRIGVEVSFKQTPVFTAASDYTRWLGAREELDVMTVAFAPMAPFIQMNMVMPLDDLLVHAPHVRQLAEDGVAIYDPNSTGHVYGLSAVGKPKAGTAGAVYVFEEALQAANLSYTDGQAITLEDVDAIARGYKAVNPKAYVNLVGSAPKGDLEFVVDALGASTSSGVLMGTDSSTVVNFFETEEYQSYIKILRGWYLDGIVLKDAATIDIMDAGSMISDPDNCFMLVNNADLGLVRDYEGKTGKRIYQLLTTPIYSKAIAAAGSFMTIPVTASHPEAAMRFMDLLYYDKEVSNLLYRGIEGETYRYLNEERNGIAPIDGVSYVSLGLYGDVGICVGFGEYDAEYENKILAWEKEGMANPTKGFGFCYDTTNMINQITAIDAVMAEYRAALETGSADIDKVYPEFINKLKANGIDQVIADKQAQLDAWLNQK